MPGRAGHRDLLHRLVLLDGALMAKKLREPAVRGALLMDLLWKEHFVRPARAAQYLGCSERNVRYLVDSMAKAGLPVLIQDGWIYHMGVNT